MEGPVDQMRDQTTAREDRIPGGADPRPTTGRDDLRPKELEGAVETPSPASGSDAVAGALATEEATAEEEGRR